MRIPLADYAHGIGRNLSEATCHAKFHGHILGMHASPENEACDDISEELADEVAAEDPRLVFVELKSVEEVAAQLRAAAETAVSAHIDACIAQGIALSTQADVDAVPAYDPGNGPDVASQILGGREYWSLDDLTQIARQLDDGSDEFFNAENEAWEAVEAAARRAYRAMPQE